MNRPLRQPNHIVISHVYSSDNKGDAALVSVLIKDLKRTYTQATITILQLESVKKGGRFEGVAQKPSFMHYVANKYHNPFVKLVYAVYMMGATLWWAVWRRFMGKDIYLPAHLREIAHIYQRADLVVAVGGGYIRSRPGLVNRCNIPLLLHPLLFGYVLGKPTVLYSQSVGPFQNSLEKLLVAFVLRRMTLILLREDTSLTLLKSLGVSHNTARAIDAGFLFTSPHKFNIRKHYTIPAHTLLIGVTVRDWLQGEAQAAYERAVAKALDAIIETADAHVIFIPQVTAIKGDDDRVTSRRVRGLMRRTDAVTLVDNAPGHHRIKAMYANLDALLGTRFHSVIFALTSFVPVVAVEYEHKTSGIMRDIGLGNWVVKIEHATAKKLTFLLKKVVREQATYRLQLRKQVPPYVRRALKNADLLAESYDTATQQD